MSERLKKKILNVVNGKLSEAEIVEVVRFIKQVASSNLYEDEQFFKEIAYEMTGAVKELALLVIDFRRDLKNKVHPELNDLATKYIPEAADQLEGIIETTEKAANKIMDNLDLLQEQTTKMEGIVASFKSGKMRVPGKNMESIEVDIDPQLVEKITPLLDHIEITEQNNTALITDMFVQMSFQDLTGQRIKKIMTLVHQMEEKLKKMVVCFGVKLSAKEKNPDISSEELQRVVDEKVFALSGPQKAGQGLDQGDIDSLLASL
ncbi:MAG: protein phosphatase CheZ [Proteobacteria bacterium]|nr:protein phosphatase CheZ [Pseudomonadota bacterium]